MEGQGENESASTANITRERINGESKIIKEVKKGDIGKLGMGMG